MPSTHRLDTRQHSRNLSRSTRLGRCLIEPLESRTLLSVVTPIGPGMPGGPMMGFGPGGQVSHAEPGFANTSGVALQGDKSIIIGPYGPAGSREFGVTRFNADGSFDTTFGSDGVVYTSFGGDDVPSGIQVLPEGKIVVVGTDTTAGGSQFAMAQYTVSGGLDPMFGNGTGQVLTSFSTVPGTLSHDVVNDVLAGPGGTLYLAGSSDADGRQRDFAVAEYGPDGGLTSTHGGIGKLLIDFSGGDDQIAAITILADHGLVLAGSTTPAGSTVSEVALARLVPNGGLNPNFGHNGQVVTSVGTVDDAASSVVGDLKNGILVAGHTGTGSADAGTLSSNFLLLRYNADGTLDRTFGRAGVVATNFKQPAAASRVLALPGGKIVVSGKTTPDLASLSTNGIDVAVAQYNPNGRLDTTFNTTGAVILHLATGTTTSVAASVGGAHHRPAATQLFPTVGSDNTSDLETEFQVLITSSEGAIAVTSGGQLLAVGTSTDGTTEASLASSGVDLSLALTIKLPTSVIASTTSSLSVTIFELGSSLASGAASINLYFSTANDSPGSADPFQTLSDTIKLKTGKSTLVKLKTFTYSTSLLEGDYYILATISLADVTDIDTTNNTAASASTVHIAPPFIDLTGSSFPVPVFKTNKSSTLTLTLTNAGNETATGTPEIQFLASPDGTLSAATALATLPAKLKTKPGASAKVKEKLSIPTTLPAGTYVLLATIDVGDVFNDTDLTNNLLAGKSSFTVA